MKAIDGKSNVNKETERHDRAMEEFDKAQARYQHERTKLLDWIETQKEITQQAKQDFTNTDYALKLYNKMHAQDPITMPRKPKFSDLYTPSKKQKNAELAFVGLSALGLGYAAFKYL